jgi:Cu(I)-responsive transcriptional regulator
MNIGQASQAAGISQRMIRHYETLALIPRPARRESGYRDFSQADVERLKFIGRARDLGFSIEEIGALLALWMDRSRASADVKKLALARAEELKRKEAEIAGMRRTLEHLAANCHGDARPGCPILEDLARPA